MYRKAFSITEMDEQHVVEFADALLSLEERGVKEKRAERGTASALRDVLECPVCEELFYLPVTLICGHSFCSQCLSRGKKEKLAPASCPTCAFSSDVDYSQNLVLRSVMCDWFGEEMKLREKICSARNILTDGKADEFMKCVDRLVVKFPDVSELYQARSDGYCSQGLFREALMDLKKVCELNPFKSDAFFKRAVLLVFLGRLEEAVVMYLRAAASKPNHTNYQRTFVTALSQLFRKITMVQLPTMAMNSCFRPQENLVPEQINPGTKTGLRDFYQTRVDGSHDLKVETMVALVEGKSHEPSLETRFSATGNPWAGQQEEYTAKQTVGSRRQFFEATREKQEARSVLSEELECKLCFNMMYQPVTTPCGHSFCRPCLERCLDHRFGCPCCRTDLGEFFNLCTVGKQGVCVALEQLLRLKFDEEYEARKTAHDSELEMFARYDGNTAVIPIFVCVVAVPDVPCPLHIFEPRYKLMIRRCMQSGSGEFGMCVPDNAQGYAMVGTTLVVNNIEMLPDGRCIVQTMGGQRFKVLEKSMKDGYNVAKVEWLVDENGGEHGEDALNANVYSLMLSWFLKLSSQHQECITEALGQVPSLDQSSDTNGPKWLWWLLAAIPLNVEAKLIILSMTSLRERLSSTKRFLELLLR